MISLEKLKILTPLQKLPENVGDMGKLIVAKGFKNLPNLVTLIPTLVAVMGSPMLVDPPPTNKRSLSFSLLLIFCSHQGLNPRSLEFQPTTLYPLTTKTFFILQSFNCKRKYLSPFIEVS